MESNLPSSHVAPAGSDARAGKAPVNIFFVSEVANLIANRILLLFISAIQNNCQICFKRCVAKATADRASPVVTTRPDVILYFERTSNKISNGLKIIKI